MRIPIQSVTALDNLALTLFSTYKFDVTTKDIFIKKGINL